MFLLLLPAILSFSGFDFFMSLIFSLYLSLALSAVLFLVLVRVLRKVSADATFAIFLSL